MKRSRCLHYIQAITYVGLALLANMPAAHARLRPVALSELTVTEGTIQELENKRLSITAPKVRAVVNTETSAEKPSSSLQQIVPAPIFQSAKLRFTYKGTTTETIPLESGEMREQLGLKLLAQDSCNLIYIMWRIQSEPKIVVSVKSNPGQTESSECGNTGYTTLTGDFSAAPPALAIGDTHALFAYIQGSTLKAYVDTTLVWKGTLPADALSFTGPVGLRTDNSQIDFSFFASMPLY